MKAESGTKEWFKDIFDKNYEYIRNYLIYLSGDTELSEDLAQDVFLQLWETRSKARDETIRSYLFTIARNSFFKVKRRRKYDIKYRSTYFEDVENKSPEFLMELKEFDQKLQKIISRMPDKCRAVFLMNRIDGMTYKEIARDTSVTVKAVEKQMSRALSVLRKELGTGI
jgi:RNA polymerase sigma-70 factor (family 1)